MSYKCARHVWCMQFVSYSIYVDTRVCFQIYMWYVTWHFYFRVYCFYGFTRYMCLFPSACVTMLQCLFVCLFVLTWNLYLLKVSGLTFRLLTCYWQCLQVNIHLLLMPMNRSFCICVTFYHLLYTLNVLFCYGHLLGCLAFNYFLYTLHTVIHR